MDHLAESNKIRFTGDFNPFERNKVTVLVNKIYKGLSEFPNLTEIVVHKSSFGILIRGKHKEIKGYFYGDGVLLKEDFSNEDDCVERFVTLWKESDNEKDVARYKGFIEQGEKWGWD